MIPQKWITTFDDNVVFLITGQFKKIPTFKNKLKNALKFKKPVLVLRFNEDQDDQEQVVEISQKFCKKNNIPLVLNIPNKWSIRCDGIHLKSNELDKNPRKDKILGASCHNKNDIQAAINLGADYIFLSPIIAKAESQPIGWDAYFELCLMFPNIKIIPLGGVNEMNSMTDSYAGISHWWDLQTSQ